jgi:hypothetical protein
LRKGEAVNKTEVIVERRRFTKREERFSDWSIGYLRRMVKVVQELCMHNCVDVVSVVERDVFKMFSGYWREAKRVKEVLGADVAVGICSGNECIDLSEDVSYTLITSKYRLRKLVRVRNALRKLVGEDRLDKVSTMSGNGIVTLDIKGCLVDLYVDEAVALAGLLLSYLYGSTKLEVIWRLHVDIVRAFKADEIGVEVDVENEGHGLHVKIDTCGVYLTNEEVLQFVYKLLDASIWQIETE